MKIHHLSCGCMCPFGGKIFPDIFPRKVICHCLLIETRNSGLVLIDTGFSKAMLAQPRRTGFIQPFLGLQQSFVDSALDQITQLGYAVKDVRHLIPTHLDNDHAGAIGDFPETDVHVFAQELNAALKPRGLVEWARYRDFVKAENVSWIEHSAEQGENWFGFKGVRAIDNADDEILLIPLFGHTRGHMGVAVKSRDRWLLHAGDAYYSHLELKRASAPGFELFQRVVHGDFKRAIENQQRLSELKRQHGSLVDVFCAHDPYEMPSAVS